MAAGYDMTAMNLNAPFCPCGALLDIADLERDGGTVQCPDCALTLSLGECCRIASALHRQTLTLPVQSSTSSTL